MVPLAAALQDLWHSVTIVAPPYTNPEDSGKIETVRGVTVKNIELGPRNKYIAAFVLAGRLLAAVRAEKPDIVHLFKPKGYGGLAAFALLAGKKLKIGPDIPLFVDSDDWEGAGGMNELRPYGRIEKLVFSLQEKWLQKLSDGVTAASRVLQARASHLGVRRVLYLPNCVDDTPPGNGAGIRKRLGIADDAPVVLLYTRFFEFEQNRLHLILGDIYRRVPAVRFLVLGKGRNGEDDELIRAAAKLGFASSLAPAGWVEPAEIQDHIAVGDVAIYPFDDNLVNRAKCPAKLTEILRAGVPVVADGVGQIAEYIDNGKSGILCDPGQWREMADRVVALLQDPGKRRSLGGAGRRSLLDNFNWRRFAVQLHEFYSGSGTG
jgi:glycosyltransferase involved in cell wall biosynthesis